MAIESFERILGEHPFFQGLGQAHLATLVGCASNVKFAAGEFIFRQGAAADRFYVVRHGKVALELFAPGEGTVATTRKIPGREAAGASKRSDDPSSLLSSSTGEPSLSGSKV